MAFGVDALDDGGPLRVPVVDVAAPTAADDEEGCFCAMVGEDVEELGGVGGWAVVKG